MLLPFQGVHLHMAITQGVALGYLLVGLSGRFISRTTALSYLLVGLSFTVSL